MSSVEGIFNKNAEVYTGKSDDFFKDVKFTPIACAFIDGDHLFEAVYKDFYNTLELMVDDGVIFLHDTLPPDETWHSENKCGTVYKLRELLDKDDKFDIFSFKNTAMDVGLTMVQKRKI